ncbi:MAG: acyltransferase domain-containing protein [Planctomycetaceae bacterium]|nr:acyltransferase domain-containing protein [Planctomycetaceae bacterium]
MNDVFDSERILEVLSKARAEIERLKQPQDERIAIVGMAARLPGAESVNDFWQLLQEGQSGIRDLSKEELVASGVEREVFEQPNYVRRWASFDDPTGFDAAFFGYSPGEAEILDPQHRVFLECAWQALEDAGYDSQQYDGRIGVFAGAALNSYLINLHNNPQTRDSINQVQAVVSNVMGLMPTRVSYHLDLHGPSCGIQTGCSTSLVAVHAACRNLLDQDCDLALAGGVTIGQMTPAGYLYEEGSIASPDGHCRTFDAAGQGTVFGNGVGLVVLKRLSDALRDGDTIRSVVLASSINNDGADKVGLLAPSVTGQAEVISSAFKRAGIHPSTVGYIEAHGTATELGDPIEFAALEQAIGQPLRQASADCAIGSVKSNLGHLDAAAGIAGLLKAALALDHGLIPASLDFERPNPQLDLNSGPFYVNKQAKQWKKSESPRRAGVSSFGMGGTNAHVILEEPPSPTELLVETGQSDDSFLLPLSARSKTALREQRRRLAEFLHPSTAPAPTGARHPSPRLADVAYTLQIGRREFPYRHVVVCDSASDACQQLLANMESDQPEPVDSAPAIVFMFPGQASQYAGMTRELYTREPSFRETIDHCSELLGDEINLKKLLFEAEPTQLNQTANAQPLLFAVEYGLAILLKRWGIHPTAMIGHSLGEYVAACLAGVFSLEDALRLVRFRGELMQACEPGAMVAIFAAQETLHPLLETGLELAAKNGPHFHVISGSEVKIVELEQRLNTQEISFQRLETSHAFHSEMLKPTLKPFRRHLETVQMGAPEIKLVSNRTGDWLTPSQATDPAYWVEQLRHTVKFDEGIAKLGELSKAVFVEVGPGQNLCRFANAQLGDDVKTLATLPGRFDQRTDQACLAQALGSLWQEGSRVNWHATHHQSHSRLPLPTYPFERTSFYVQPSGTKSNDPTPVALTKQQKNKGAAEEKRTDLKDWFYVPSWKNQPLVFSAPKSPSSTVTVAFGFAKQRHAFSRHCPDLPLIWVEPSDKWSAAGDRYTIDPTSANDYRQLKMTIEQTGREVTQWIHLWSLQPDAVDNIDGLTAFSQGILTQSNDTPICLDVVTCGTFQITECETMHEVNFTIPGFIQCLPDEFPGCKCRVVECEAEAFESVSSPIVRQLRSPFLPEEQTIAFRGRHRWVQSYSPLPLAETTTDLLQPRADYLIVGDLLDGLGMVYAKALREQLDARVMLIGPDTLPAVKDWDRYSATHGSGHPICQLIHKLKSLGREGDDFSFATTDIEKSSCLSKTIESLKATLPCEQIQGIFYADVMGGEASCEVNELGREERDRILDHKLRVIKALMQATSQHPPQFAVLQSSLSSIVGGRGFAAYAAANSYLDQLSAWSPIQPVLSINWDACQLDALEKKSQSELLSAAISPTEVWEATKRIIACREFPQVIVSPRPLTTRIIRSAKATTTAIHKSTTTNNISRNKFDLQSDYLAPSTPVEVAVAKAMGNLLGIEDIGVNDDFFALGGHSLLAIQAITKLRKEFEVELPMRAILQGTPTVAGISQVIEENLSSISDEDASVLEDLLEQIEAKR